MKMSTPRVRSFGYFAVRRKVSEFSPALCIVSHGARQTWWLAAVTKSKSVAGSDFANSVRQIKSSKYLPRNDQSLTLRLASSVCLVRGPDMTRRALATTRRTRTAEQQIQSVDTQPMECFL